MSIDLKNYAEKGAELNDIRIGLVREIKKIKKIFKDYMEANEIWELEYNDIVITANEPHRIIQDNKKSWKCFSVIIRRTTRSKGRAIDFINNNWGNEEIKKKIQEIINDHKGGK